MADEGLYLFCVMPAGVHPGTSIASAFGHPVQGLDVGPLTLWIAPLTAPPEPSLDAVRVHHRVVAEAARTGVTPVPVRFRQWFPSREALEEALAPRSELLARALDRLTDTEEYGLRVLDAGAPPSAAEEIAAPAATVPDAPSPGRGRAYLDAVNRRLRAATSREEGARALGEALARALGDAVVEQQVAPLPSTHGVATVAHLVRVADRERYRERLAGFRAGRPDLRFLRSGPWPPYSFAP